MQLISMGPQKFGSPLYKRKEGEIEDHSNLFSKKSIKSLEGGRGSGRSKEDDMVFGRDGPETTNAFFIPESQGARHCGKPRGTRDLITSLGGYFGIALTLRPDARNTDCMGEGLGIFCFLVVGRGTSFLEMAVDQKTGKFCGWSRSAASIAHTPMSSGRQLRRWKNRTYWESVEDQEIDQRLVGVAGELTEIFRKYAKMVKGWRNIYRLREVISIIDRIMDGRMG